MSKTLFHLTALATTAFIITILAMVAMLVGDPNAPVNVWFNVYGAVIMTVEVIAIGLFGMAAMVMDRHETLREAENHQSNSVDSDSASASVNTVTGSDADSRNDQLP